MLKSLTEKNKIAIASFLILFPGYYLYSFLTSIGFTPILGGYLVASSLLCFLMLMPSYLLSIYRGNGTVIDFTFWAFIVFCAIWISISSIYIEAHPAIKNYTAMSIVWPVFFTLGKLLSQEYLGSRKILIFSYWTIIFIIFLNIRDGSLMFIIYNKYVVSYQHLSLLLFINSVLLLSLIKSDFSWYLLFFLTLIALFFIGARSEAFTFVLVGVFSLIKSRLNILTILATLVIITFANQLITLSDGMFFRIYDIFQNGTQSGSAILRFESLDHTINTINRNPVIGDFASYPPGLYVHNLLSIYVDFGLLGFLFYILMLVFSFLLVRKYIQPFNNASDMVNNFYLALLILLLFAKSGVYVLVPFVLGISAGLFKKGFFKNKSLQQSTS